MPNEGSYEAAKRRSDEVHADLLVHPENYTMLTGDRPTGRLHLGHYFGTLVDRVRLQDMGVRTNVIIADYQVITDRDTTEHIKDNVYNMVIDYLACGLDPAKTMIFTHSAVPELNQLMLPFLSLVTEAEMERNPTVKAEQEAPATPSRDFCSPTPCTRRATSSSARATSCPWAATSCRTSRSPRRSRVVSTSATATYSRTSRGFSPPRRCFPASTAAR